MAGDLSRTVVVLDLDDTLYPESRYVLSGKRYLRTQLQDLLGRPLDVDLDGSDWLDDLRAGAGLPVSAKETLLWMYRLHLPTIELEPECASTIEHLQRHSAAVVILTDGRAITQRLKLKALNLAHLPVYVSEDHQSEKPHPLRFQMIENDYPALAYVYVADNPAKDFLPCNAMGWTTIGIRTHGQGIHSQDVQNLPLEALPQRWVSNWQEVYSTLC